MNLPMQKLILTMKILCLIILSALACHMSTNAKMSSPSTELCISNFLEQTAEATDWYLLGVFMKIPPKDLSLIEKQYSSGGSARCKAELFNVWMKRTPNASWELIAAALEKLGETVLVEKIRKRCTSSILASQSQITDQIISTPSSASLTVRVVLDKSLVVLFSTLEREFAVVVKNLEVLLKKRKYH